MFHRIVKSSLVFHLCAAFCVAVICVVTYNIVVTIDVPSPPRGLYFSSLNSYNSGRGPAATLNYARISDMVRSGSGVIIFGSSELSDRDIQFAPYNYLSTSCHIPIIAYGQAFYQTLGMYGLLASLQQDLNPHTKIVVFISPSWFDKGDMLPQAFSLQLTDQILYRDYWNSEARTIITNYLRAHKDDFKQLTDAQMAYLSSGPKSLISIGGALIGALQSDIYFARWKAFTYIHPGPYPDDYHYGIDAADQNYACSEDAMHSYESQAQATELAQMTNNDVYVRNDYFDDYLKKLRVSKKNKINYFQPHLNNLPELRDLRALLNLLHGHGVQPLIITLPLNPYVYSDAAKMTPVDQEINALCKLYEASCVAMDDWPYTPGLLKDAVHPGELGFLKIDELIYQYFKGQS